MLISLPYSWLKAGVLKLFGPTELVEKFRVTPYSNNYDFVPFALPSRYSF